MKCPNCDGEMTEYDDEEGMFFLCEDCGYEETRP